MKQNLTGKEIEIGQTPFDLAEYAKDANITRKLYITEAKDMYVEVNVKSKQIDEDANKRLAGNIQSQRSEVTGQQSLVSQSTVQE